MRARTVELQAAGNQLDEDAELDVGLKTGARVALLLPDAHERLMAYREALEARFGAQPEYALVFQACHHCRDVGAARPRRLVMRRVVFRASRRSHRTRAE